MVDRVRLRHLLGASLQFVDGKLDVRSNFATETSYTPVSGPGTHTAESGEVLLVDLSAGDFEVELPASHAVGNRITVVLTSAVGVYSCTLTPGAGQTISGEDEIVLAYDYEYITIVSDGTDWYQV